jgi:hypothetical protein
MSPKSAPSADFFNKLLDANLCNPKADSLDKDYMGYIQFWVTGKQKLPYQL